MGEYALRKSDQVQVKIGTCESMYYIRWDDRDKVSPIEHSLDPSDTPNLYWRLPVPEEDHLEPGDYDSGFPAVTLVALRDEDTGKAFDYEPSGEVKPGSFQMFKEECGLLLNVPCYHGHKVPDMGEGKAFFNGKARYWWELCGVKNHESPDGSIELLPLVRCRFCGNMFRETWAGILLHIPEGPLRERLVDYAALGQIVPA